MCRCVGVVEEKSFSAGAGRHVKGLNLVNDDDGDVEQLSVTVNGPSGLPCHDASLTELPNQQLGMSLSYSSQTVITPDVIVNVVVVTQRLCVNSPNV